MPCLFFLEQTQVSWVFGMGMNVVLGPQSILSRWCQQIYVQPPSSMCIIFVDLCTYALWVPRRTCPRPPPPPF